MPFCGFGLAVGLDGLQRREPFGLGVACCKSPERPHLDGHMRLYPPLGEKKEPKPPCPRYIKGPSPWQKKHSTILMYDGSSRDSPADFEGFEQLEHSV